MAQKLRVVLLGTTCSGKTSVGRILAERYGLPIIEVDWEAQKIDPDIFRKHDHEFIDKTFEEINARVLKMEEVMFITSFLEPERIEDFNRAGFKIIQLYANLKELIKRRTARHQGVLSEKRANNTVNNYNSHMKIAKDQADLLAASIDTSNLSIEETAEKVYSFL